MGDLREAALNFVDILRDWDQRILLWIHQWSGSWLDPVLGWPTFLGFLWTSIPLVFLALWIWDRKHLGRNFFLFLIPVISVELIVQALKWLVARPRPFEALADEIAAGTVALKPILDVGISQHSFPSGHAALAFSAAVILNFLYRGKLWILYPLAVLISISRIYIGVHYPSDVIGGILIGTLGALLAIWIFKKYPSPHPSPHRGDGRVRGRD